MLILKEEKFYKIRGKIGKDDIFEDIFRYIGSSISIYDAPDDRILHFVNKESELYIFPSEIYQLEELEATNKIQLAA